MNSQLKTVLCETFLLENVLLCGRASSGLFALLKAIRDESGPGSVIVPSICCPSVVFAIIYSGLKPLFADVTMSNFTIDPKSVERIISPTTKAILAVHIFGHHCDIAAIRKTTPHTIIIEDCAQGFYREPNSGAIQTKGDFTLLSFGQSKLIKSSGGALGINNSKHTKIFEKTLKYQFTENKADKDYVLRLAFRDWTEGLIATTRENTNLVVSPVFHQLAGNFRSIFLKPYRGTENDEKFLIEQIKNIVPLLEKRVAKARYYHHRLSKTGLAMPAFDELESYWRFSFLMPESNLRRELTFLLRQNKLLVSNHYFPLEKLFENTFKQNSEIIAERIVNLFCCDLLSCEDQERTVDIILTFMDQNSGITG